MGSPSRQLLKTSRPEERTPCNLTFAPTDVSDSEMEGGEEDMKSRAKDDLSSGYELTDMSDERELENADEIGEGEAKESPRRRSFRPRNLDERSWEATRQWRCRRIKTLIG